MDQPCVSRFALPPSYAFESQCQGCAVPMAPYRESGPRSHQYVCSESKDMSRWFRGCELGKNTQTRVEKGGFLEEAEAPTGLDG